MKEIWKIIEYFPEYTVSNLGRIKSLKFSKERILKLKKSKKGYFEVCLCKYNKKYFKRVNIVVLETFTEKSNLECNHIDGDKSNNKLENLEWLTRSENEKHAFRIRLKYRSSEWKKNMSDKMSGKNNPMYGKKRSREFKKNQSDKMKGKYIGENHPRSKFKEKDIINIKIDLKNGMKQREIAKKYNTHQRTISNIKNNKIWKGIGK